MSELERNIVEDLKQGSGCSLGKLMNDMPLEERFATLREFTKQNREFSMPSDAGVSSSDIYSPDAFKHHTEWHFELDKNTTSLGGFKHDRQAVYSEDIDLKTLTIKKTSYDSKHEICK